MAAESPAIAALPGPRPQRSAAGPPSPRIVWASAWCSLRLRLRGVRSGVVRCDGRTPVIYGAGRITIGRRLSVRGRTARAELGALVGGSLVLGSHVYLNQGSSVLATESITIGDRVLIGDHAAIHDSDYHSVGADSPARVSPITIGDDVWIGRGAIVMPGVSIGDGTVVAAGAVVTRSLPSRCLAGGVPARVIRPIVVPDGWRRV